MKKVYITWENIEESKRCLEEYKDKVDYIVCVLRGGMIPALLASHILDVPICYVQFKSYIGSKRRLTEYTNFSINSNIFGKRVLIVDDIFDSGKTLQNAIKIVQKFKPSQIKTFVLVTKNELKCDNLFIDYYTSVSKKLWCVFPWESK